MDHLFKQENIVTSPFNQEMMLEGFKKQLSSDVLNELIIGEKYGLRITLTIDLIETQDEL